MEWPSFPAGALERGKIKAEPGMTAKWGVTPNLILNATANPDFSQVEADVAQLRSTAASPFFIPKSGRSSSKAPTSS